MRLGGSAGCLAATLLMAAITAASAKEETESLSLSSNLEYRLEIGQHERLIETRKSEGAKLARRHFQKSLNIMEIGRHGRVAAWHTTGFTMRGPLRLLMPK